MTKLNNKALLVVSLCLLLGACASGGGDVFRQADKYQPVQAFSVGVFR